MKNSVDPDQLLHQKPADLGQHYFKKWSIFSKSYAHSVLTCMCALILIYYKVLIIYIIQQSIIVNVLKFQTLVGCQKGLDKQCTPRSGCF